MCIGLVIAIIIIVALGFCLHSFLEDYLIDTGTWPPKLDLERFLYDMANKFIDSLYASAALPVADGALPIG